MAINAEVLTSFNKIDEAYIDGLLKKEIEANNKKIVVLDDGVIVGMGTHDTLIDSCEVYREIYESQYGKGAR